MTEKVLVTPAELQGMMGRDVVVIDTRSPDAYAAGHIPGAVNVHEIFTFLATSTPEGMAELRGGFHAWKAAGMATTTEATVAAGKEFPLSNAGGSMMIDRDAMLAAVGDDSIVKLDVRDVDEWVGTSSSPYGPDFCPRKGRIPGAKWLEWYRMMKPTAAGPMFKSPDEIMAEAHTAGIGANTPVYLYCFKGARASNTLVALKEAGVQDVRMYFGSWNEWSRDESLPIESGMPFAQAAE